jgi:hypothetical protein
MGNKYSQEMCQILSVLSALPLTIRLPDIPQVAATHRVINLNYSIHGVLKQINAI